VGVRRRKIVRRSGLLGLALSLALAGTASASTICVLPVDPALPPCDQTEATIAAAFNDAQTNPGHDIVRLGATAYDETGLTTPLDVEVRGAGDPDTTIAPTSMANNQTVLTVNGTAGFPSSVTNLKIAVPTSDSDTGLTLSSMSSADRVTVTQGGGTPTNTIGVEMDASFSDIPSLSNATILLPFSGPPNPSNSSTGIRVDGSQSARLTISDVFVSAGQGVFAQGGNFALRRARITSAGGVNLDGFNNLDAQLEDVLVLLSDQAPGNAVRYAVRASNSVSGKTTTASVHQLTAIGPPNSQTPAAIGVWALGIDGGTANVDLRDSILRMAPPSNNREDLQAESLGSPPGHANIAVDYSDFRAASVQQVFPPDATVTQGSHNLDDVDPVFVNPVTGNFHLQGGSPVIDRGSTTPANGETDLDGNQRLLIGRPGCLLARDMGAYEFQSTVTFAKATVPAVVQLGQPATFDATGSCAPDPSSQTLQYAWSFDDGDSAGDVSQVSHTFTTGGIHHGTVSVHSSDYGLSQDTATVRVNRPPVPVLIVGPNPASVGQEVDFDASKSTDPDGDTLSYSWSFDDGTTATGAVVQHAFATAGEHQAILTLTDSSGGSRTATATVTVNTAPPPAPPPEKPVPEMAPPLLILNPEQELTETPPMRVKETVVPVSPKGIAKVKVAVPPDIPGPILVNVLLEARSKTNIKPSGPKQGKAAAAVTMGKGRATVASGQTATVRVRLSRTGRALMRHARHHRLRATAVVTAKAGSAARRTTRSRVTMRS
jgi:PKD domain